jgi:hypothetical protein
MARKKKNKTFVAREGQWASDTPTELDVPDEAIYYIVSHYLQGKAAAEGVPAVIGISTQTVEDVLQLFIDWAARNNHIEDGVLTIGNK